MVVYNKTQRSADYSEIAGYYRPGHADYTFDEKYGFRDYRGGGRSSGRETIARVAAGAIAAKLLKELGIEVDAYTKSVGSVEIDYDNFNLEERFANPVCMPDAKAAAAAQELLSEKMQQKDSVGGVVECVVKNLMPGIGEPVFDKLDARLGQAILSIGAVKGFEIGAGFAAAKMSGSEDNDSFYAEDGTVKKYTNHAGGMLGGISDGSDIVLRAAFKPTPSIFQPQKTINREHENIEVSIKGRHDPIIVPRAVVVVEAMTAMTVLDLLLLSMSSTLSGIQKFFKK
jgi:chorismate synthase